MQPKKKRQGLRDGVEEEGRQGRKEAEGFKQRLMALPHHVTVGLSPFRIYIIRLGIENNVSY